MHHFFDIVAGVVLVSSAVGSLLPPWEWFADFPRFQKGYKLFVMVVARWGAINLKSVVYPSINGK